jgi:hypothetical protein
VISRPGALCCLLARVAGAFASAALLTACAIGMTAELELKAVSQLDGACIANIDGEAVPYEISLERFSELRSQYRNAVIISSGSTEYQCIGGIIFNLQRAKFRTVRVQAEPPM